MKLLFDPLASITRILFSDPDEGLLSRSSTLRAALRCFAITVGCWDSAHARTPFCPIKRATINKASHGRQQKFFNRFSTLLFFAGTGQTFALRLKTGSFPAFVTCMPMAPINFSSISITLAMLSDRRSFSDRLDLHQRLEMAMIFMDMLL